MPSACSKQKNLKIFFKNKEHRFLNPVWLQEELLFSRGVTSYQRRDLQAFFCGPHNLRSNEGTRLIDAQETFRADGVMSLSPRRTKARPRYNPLSGTTTLVFPTGSTSPTPFHASCNSFRSNQLHYHRLNRYIRMYPLCSSRKRLSTPSPIPYRRSDYSSSRTFPRTYWALITFDAAKYCHHGRVDTDGG